MSETGVSALNGARQDGVVTVAELGLQGMVTLKADLSSDRVAGAIKGVTGADMPAVRAITPGTTGQVAWMAPDELLILCPHAEAETITAALKKKLETRHHLAVNVSDARAMFSLTGEEGALKDTLAKITPADMAALEAGEMRRTRLQQVPAAIWLETGTEARVICFRSVAKYVFDLLTLSAQEGGAVGYH